ncbi:MAG: alpha/beta hydrolase [Bacteroidia bacterium]|nr:alpha/beta hydrolase [Bacteroidia bacterium]
MEKAFIWRNSEINYITFGTGPQNLVCFHGYGQNCEVFRTFEPSLGSRFTIVSVDLPFQGKTNWREKEKLTGTMLCDLINSFLEHINARNKVSLMAYSIGGNYALGFATAFPQRIDEIWLLAADGLKPKPAFRFITQTALGRSLFANFVLYPSWVFYSLRIAQILGITNRRTTKFYYSTMDTQLKREALFNRWSSTARISVHPNTAIQVINQHEISVKLIFGERDSVIPAKNARNFHKKMAISKLVLLDKGHQLIVPETNKVIEELLG